MEIKTQRLLIRLIQWEEVEKVMQLITSKISQWTAPIPYPYSIDATKILFLMNKILLIFLFILCFPALLYAKDTVHKIVVYKSARKMELWDKDSKLIRSYKIALGGNPIGHKNQAGDKKTPEGNYKIAGRNANSRFHKSLRISYPNADDIAQATKRGVSPGGDVMIHGLPKGIGWIRSLQRLYGWTAGCIAVTNDEIDEIWDLVPDGTPIEIRP